MSFLTLFSLFLLASVKFVVGVPAAYAALHLGFFELILFAVVSGVFGVSVFIFLSDFLFKLWDQFAYRYLPKKDPSKKKIFTKRNRRYVKLVKTYGLMGISLLTPTIISIPVGTILARRFFENRWQVYAYLCGSVVLWSIALSAILHFPSFFKSI
jgi:hypothetical protein